LVPFLPKVYPMLIRTIYVSRASSALPRELKDILATSRNNNPVRGISGAMCLINGVYLQCLEGEAAVVDALYQKIISDTRHTVPKLLERQVITQREFPKWAMALLTWNEETQVIFRCFNPDQPLDAYEADPLTIGSLLRSWAGTANWMTV
jgi:hypothetical protein